MEPELRPVGVPAEAWWHETWESWVLGEHSDNSNQGVYKFWETDGSYGENQGYFQQGKFYYHGSAKGFYQNAEKKYEENNKNDVPVGKSVKYRCSDPSVDSEDFANFGSDVWRFERIFDGRVTCDGRYYAKTGIETDCKGNPLPPRPQTIHPEAAYLIDSKQWYYGLYYLQNGHIQKLGRWQWWTKDGQLIAEDEYGLKDSQEGKWCNSTPNVTGYLLKEKIYDRNGFLI